MRTYALRRLVLFVPTLVGGSLLIFVLMRLVPGDIAEILVYQTGSEASAVQQKQIAQIRRELGLDRPVAVQYLAWLGDAVRGDFGFSYSQRRPVSEILAERFPRSMELAVLTLALAVAWSIPLGVVSAVVVVLRLKTSLKNVPRRTAPGSNVTLARVTVASM